MLKVDFRSSVGPVALLVAVMMTAPAAASAQSGDLTVPVFTSDIAPILYRSCVNCHRPNEVAPMSLLTYSDARPWARSIRNRVASREMPPWHIDRRIGIQDFKNDPSLTAEEIDTIVRWVEGGAPQGDPAAMPPMPDFGRADAWQIGEPDLVVRFPDRFVPASGPDQFGSLTTPMNLEEDRYIQAIQTRTVDDRSRQVVHHALSYAVERSPDASGSMADSTFLVEYASGKMAEVYPEGTGLLVPGGRDARLSYHLHSIGEEVNAGVELGIVFHPAGTVPEYIRWSKQLASANGRMRPLLDLPAGAVTRNDGYERLNFAAKITMFQPHMHILGKYQCLELIYPTQPVRSEVVNCANFDYNWHLPYNYSDEAAPIVPAGTIVHIISWHDNTASHRGNPDPSNITLGGDRTLDEMGFAWIGWYDLTEEEYEAELAAREAARSNTNN